jgi:predicted metal-dependent hydrolase
LHSAQLILPLVSPSSSTPRLLRIGPRTYNLEIARHPRARRYLLRVAADGTLRLTVPRGAAIAAGLRFAARQGPWIERERLRQSRRLAPWINGSVVWFRGRQEPLIVDGAYVRCGSATVSMPPGAGDLRGPVEAHLRAVAQAELPSRCLDLAKLHGLAVAKVSVRNQQSRWGACSSRRVITLNWRLVQMPPAVAEYILLHELMHLRQANHSRRFWREVDAVCAHWRDSERWLRTHGRELI